MYDKEEPQEDRELTKEARDTANAVVKLCGIGGEKWRRAFIVELAFEHRTLQQAVADLFRMFFLEMAKKEFDRDTDLRNESAVKLAKAVEEIMKDHPLPFI